MDTGIKIAFNLPLSPSVVLVMESEQLLWVAHTLEQYADIDAEHGPFEHDEIHFVGAGLYPNAPAAQYLMGGAAQMVATALMEVRLVPDRNVRTRIGSGITSVNWRIPNTAPTTVVCGRQGQRAFFGVVFTLSQLRAMQERFFPDEPDRLVAFQSKARLPDSSHDQPFVLEDDDALAAIDGCHRLGYLHN